MASGVYSKSEVHKRLETIADGCSERLLCHQSLQTAYYQISLYLAVLIGAAQLATGATGLSTLSTSSGNALGVVAGTRPDT